MPPQHPSEGRVSTETEESEPMPWYDSDTEGDHLTEGGPLGPVDHNALNCRPDGDDGVIPCPECSDAGGGRNEMCPACRNSGIVACPYYYHDVCPYC